MSLQVVSIAIDMDVDSTAAAVDVDAKDFILPAAALGTDAAAGSRSPGTTVQRLLLVVDTNILLSKAGVQLLDTLQQQYGPKAAAAPGSEAADAAAASGNAGMALHLTQSHVGWLPMWNTTATLAFAPQLCARLLTQCGAFAQ